MQNQTGGCLNIFRAENNAKSNWSSERRNYNVC